MEKTIVMKGNVQYTIDKDDLGKFLESGFHEIDGDGNVLTRSTKRTLESIEMENKELHDKVAKYEAEIKKLKSQVKKSNKNSKATETEKSENEKTLEEVAE